MTRAKYGSLTAEDDAFIAEIMETGKYQSATEVLRDAVQLLLQRCRRRKQQRLSLQEKINAGVEALERGEYREFDDASLDAEFERLNELAMSKVR